MSTNTLSPKFNAVVAGEIRVWHQEQIISDELCRRLLDRYPEAAPGSLHITVLTIVGAVLLGLGGLLFVASNWATIGAVAKIIIILSAMLGSYYAGWRFKYEPGNRPRVGAALILLGSIIYGAGIWLLAQIFNMDLSLGSGLFLWALGATAVALATRSGANTVLASLLIMASATVGLSEWSWFGSSQQWGMELQLMTLRIIGGFFIAAALSHRTRSSASFAIAVIGSCVGICFYHPYLGLVPWGVTLVCGYFLGRNRWPVGTQSMMYGGMVSIFLGLLFLTGGDRITCDVPDNFLATILPLCALASAALVACLRANFRVESIIAGLIVVLPIVFQLLPEALRLVLTNVLLFGFLMSVVLVAQRRFHEPALVNLSIVGLVVFLMCRYFDLFFSMMDRSLAFTVGGILLLVIGSFAERSRRRLLGDVQ